MTAARRYEQIAYQPRFALGVIDGLARALHTRGAVPAPMGDVRCAVVRQITPVARTFDPPLLLTTVRNASGFVILDGTYTPADGRGGARPLGDGNFVVRVSGDLYDDQDFPLAWPPARAGRIGLGQPNQPDNIVLLPGAAYPMPDVAGQALQLGQTIIRGSLRTASGEPMAAVPVEVVNLAPFLSPAELPELKLADWPFSSTRTNALGDWVLLLPNRRYIDNTAEVPPGPPPGSPPGAPTPVLRKTLAIRIGTAAAPILFLPMWTVALGRENALENTALRGQVVGSGGRPIAGATIATSVGPATSVSRIDGRWSLFFALDQDNVDPVMVTVTTPDGAAQSLTNARVKARETVVVPTFRFS